MTLTPSQLLELADKVGEIVSARIAVDKAIADKLSATIAAKLTAKNPGFVHMDLCDERSGAIKTRITWLYALLSAVIAGIATILARQ